MNVTLMILRSSLFWLFIGFLSAVVFMLGIKLSADFINPFNRTRARVIVIAGAYVRWLLLTLLLVLAIKQNIAYALLIVFGFSLTRLIIIYKLLSKNRNVTIQVIEA